MSDVLFMVEGGEVSSFRSNCGEIVRAHDPDRYLLSYFVPHKRREALWVLFAFNYEIAKTREVVSETQLGLIRLQWWRDAIATIYEGGDIPEHEVVQPLAEIIQEYDLDRALFDALIYAREFDLEDVLPGNVEGVLNYADYTCSPLMQLAVKIAGGDAAVEPTSVVAMNYALMGILRASVGFARQRRCYLPQDVMQEYAVHVNQLYEMKRQDGLQDVVRIVADEFVSGVKCDNRFLKLSQKLSEMYCKQLKRLDYDLFNPRVILPPAFKELRLFLTL